MKYKILGKDQGKHLVEIIDEDRLADDSGTKFPITGKTDGPEQIPYGGNGGATVEIHEDQFEDLDNDKVKLVRLPGPGQRGNNSKASHKVVPLGWEEPVIEEPTAPSEPEEPEEETSQEEPEPEPEKGSISKPVED